MSWAGEDWFSGVADAKVPTQFRFSPRLRARTLEYGERETVRLSPGHCFPGLSKAARGSTMSRGSWRNERKCVRCQNGREALISPFEIIAASN